MTRSAIFVILLLLLSFSGCYINQGLTQMHMTDSSKAEVAGWLSSVCKSESNEALDCGAVIQSKWGSFPFKDPDPKTGKRNGVIPVALIGWAYFATVFIWMMLIGVVDPQRRIWHLLPTLLILGGCAGSLFFMYIMFSNLEHKCILCIASHAINFAMLLLVFLMRPKKPARTTESAGAEQGDGVTAIQPADGHPTGRLIFATLVCSVALWCAILMSYAHKKSLAYTDLMKTAFEQEIKRMGEDTQTQLAQFEGVEPVKIPTRGDDPQLLQAEGPSTKLVIFSDFQCPGCRKFSKEIAENILPSFDGHIRIIWKHYPLCTECNEHAVRNIHPNACKLAYAAEAARMQKGSEGFWTYHDLLFNNQPFLARLKPKPLDDALRGYAEEIGLDLLLFDRDRSSEEVVARVKQDIMLGKSIGVQGTPAAFFGNKMIRRYMLNNPDFMATMKKRFDQLVRRQTRRQKARSVKPGDVQNEQEEESDDEDE
ncbi:MAG: hypothetical protein DHS20C16_24720 [Phycisphaerae bacterium]|nr:MAG: hypothetical protein DHS20C16_24720 [Phycisphaerae bacterium]